MRQQVSSALEQLRRRPRAEENELQLVISTDGIKVRRMDRSSIHAYIGYICNENTGLERRKEEQRVA